MSEEKKIASYYGTIQDVKLQKKGTAVKITLECDPTAVPGDLAQFAINSIGCPAYVTIQERPPDMEEK